MPDVEFADARNPFMPDMLLWMSDALSGTVAPVNRTTTDSGTYRIVGTDLPWMALVDGWGNVVGRGDSAEEAVADAIENVGRSPYVC